MNDFFYRNVHSKKIIPIHSYMKLPLFLHLILVENEIQKTY